MLTSMDHRAPKSIVVTGASRGIGLSLVGHLHAAGHRVVAACRAPDRAVELRGLGVDVIALDVSDPSSVDELHDAVRRHVAVVDVLVNNAGIKQAAGVRWEASAGPLRSTPQRCWRCCAPTCSCADVTADMFTDEILKLL